jgi:dolichol-phosphate mannosyltransferase
METDRTLIVIPTYNERENVGPLVRALFEAAPAADVLVVDDNSPDGTVAVAEKLFGNDARFSSLIRTGPRGYGRSLLDAYHVALDRGYTFVVQMDADFSHDPRMVPAMIEAIRNADLVIGSRYCAGGEVTDWPWHRRMLSRFANLYVSLITGLDVRDSTAGFRAWRREALQHLLNTRMNSDGYAFQVEAAYRSARANLRIVEIPITFTDRRAGQSKMSGKVICESVFKPWALRLGR